MVMVYAFKGWSQDQGDNIVGKAKATREFIEQHGLEIIEQSGEDVPEDSVEDGRYRPEA